MWPIAPWNSEDCRRPWRRGGAAIRDVGQSCRRIEEDASMKNHAPGLSFFLRALALGAALSLPFARANAADLMLQVYDSPDPVQLDGRLAYEFVVVEYFGPS